MGSSCDLAPVDDKQNDPIDHMIHTYRPYDARERSVGQRPLKDEHSRGSVERLSFHDPGPAGDFTYVHLHQKHPRLPRVNQKS